MTNTTYRKHLPLRQSRFATSSLTTADGCEVPIAWVIGDGRENPYDDAEAFAAFLIRAVNCHDELIEAVEAALGLVERDEVPNWDWLRQVLARARGKQP